MIPNGSYASPNVHLSPPMNMNYPNKPDNFLQAVLEGFVDGILVLTDAGDVIYTNATADSICSQLSSNSSKCFPKELQRICEALIESRDLYPTQPLTLELEVTTPQTTYRIRAQWLQLEAVARPCILLRLQDQNRSLQGLAIAEAQKWGLTPREAEVWSLRRAGYPRKAIAAELYIAIDTVKKHLKNIQMKRQAILNEDEWRSNQAS